MTTIPRALASALLIAAAALGLVALDLPGSPAALAAAPAPGHRARRPAAKPPQPPPKEAATPAPPAAPPVLQRGSRMELDARLVRGETPRAGAVYLFQRAPRALPPLIRLDQSYLGDIVWPVLGPAGAEAAEAVHEARRAGEDAPR